MKLSTILKDYNIDLNKIKLIRHPQNRADVSEIYQAGFIEYYQSSQSKPIFDKCEYILSFLGIENTKARYIGAWKICGKCKCAEMKSKIPPSYPYPAHFDNGCYYVMEPASIMEDLKNRLIIDWGLSTRKWDQYAYNDKEIVAILPAKSLREVKEFKDYESTILSFSELETIINEPITYDDWYFALSNVNGIYLIIDRETGYQYIGSAYGADGILGRWKHYIETKDGGNIGISTELKIRPNAYKNFQFTILRILPKTITADEAIHIENLYKQKLCTRELGMNRN